MFPVDKSVVTFSDYLVFHVYNHFVKHLIVFSINKAYSEEFEILETEKAYHTFLYVNNKDF